MLAKYKINDKEFDKRFRLFEYILNNNLDVKDVVASLGVHTEIINLK